MFVCPDWYARAFENDTPQLAGKMALMPLPAAVPGGRRTSTWGGTMIGITKGCRDPERAWSLLKHLFATPAGWDQQWNSTGILPGMPESWTRPTIAATSAYWSGTAHGLAFAQLAPEVPPQYTGAYIDLAKGKYTEVMFACCRRWETQGEDGFVDFVRQRLAQAAEEVRRQMTRNPF
jgi:ABC-type glycerol-3-phosphate transport system substrate-binding protein